MENEEKISNVSTAEKLGCRLYAKKRLRIIGFAIGLAICLFGGISGIVYLPYDTPEKHTANIAAGSLFLFVAAIFLLLIIITILRQRYIVKMKDHIICVFIGLRHKYISVDNLLLYKGKDEQYEIRYKDLKARVIMSKNKIKIK